MAKCTAWTANAFSSVSLDPFLVLVCVDHRARTHAHLHARKRFGINVLRSDQQAISEYYARAFENHQQAEEAGAIFERTAHGTPVLHGALAYLECRLHSTQQAGDHTPFLLPRLRMWWFVRGSRCCSFGDDTGRLRKLRRGRWTQSSNDCRNQKSDCGSKNLAGATPPPNLPAPCAALQIEKRSRWRGVLPVETRSLPRRSSSPICPNAIRTANAGTVRNAGRLRTDASTRVKSSFRTGLGATKFTGPDIDSVWSAW